MCVANHSNRKLKLVVGTGQSRKNNQIENPTTSTVGLTSSFESNPLYQVKLKSKIIESTELGTPFQQQIRNR